MQLYRSLNSSPYASLYGSKSWTEDFAECFTWYFLAARFGISYHVTITQGNRQLLSFTPRDHAALTQRWDQFKTIIN